LDAWIQGQSVERIAPHLFAIISRRTSNTRTVEQALADRRWIRDIRGGLSVAVLDDYIHLWEKLENVQLNIQEKDTFRWRWTSDGKYTAKSA
jgi:hypothetical protein